MYEINVFFIYNPIQGKQPNKCTIFKEKNLKNLIFIKKKKMILNTHIKNIRKKIDYN